MIRLGLIGCGEHSECGHAIPLARYNTAHPGEIALAAACDLKLDRAQYFCAKYDFRNAYDGVEAMLEGEDLDACIAVVPVERISQVGIQLLEVGLRCCVEKPLGSSMGEVNALLDAARKTGTANMVSVNRRFMPLLNRAIGWARSAGPLRYVRCTFTRNARREPEFLWGTAVHAVDTLRYIAGHVSESEIQILKGTAGLARWYAIDLQFEDGICGRIDVLPTAGALEETYELMGEGYRALVTCPFGRQRGWRGFRDNRLEVEEVAAEGTAEDLLNGCYDEAAEFIRALREGQPLRPSIEDVYPSVELCWELQGAAEQKAPAVFAKS